MKLKHKPEAIVDFKKGLPSKEDLRRKNYIGDSVIAERANEDDEDEDLDQQASLPSVMVG